MAGGSMHRNAVAAFLQAAGIVTAIVAGFTISTALGAICVGVGVFLVGVAVEDDA
jgi:hypothetical protein